MIIDCHGHYTAAPGALDPWHKLQIASFEHGSGGPLRNTVDISDDQIRERLESAQLRIQRERGTDLTFFSPPASAWQERK